MTLSIYLIRIKDSKDNEKLLVLYDLISHNKLVSKHQNCQAQVQVQVRWGSGEVQEGQSQAKSSSENSKLKDLDLSSNLFLVTPKYIYCLVSKSEIQKMPDSTHPTAQVQIFEFWVLWAGLCLTLTFLTLTWTSPDLDLDLSLTICWEVNGCLA